MGFFSKVFSSGRSGKGHLLSLDIGTEVVKALIFKIDPETGNGIVVGAGRERQALGNMQSGAVSDISGVVSVCSKAIAKAMKQAGITKIKESIVGIAGELVKGTTTTVHYERLRTEDKIVVEELHTIINKVQEKAYQRIKEQIAWETGHSGVDIHLINAAIVDVRIDGYKITNPIGFQGKDVSISVFNAYAPIIHLGALQSIADSLNLSLLSIAAEPYAVARSMEVEDSLDFSAIFIDVGGGTTDIAVVRNGGLEGTKMFALGGRAFTKRLALELGISFEEAEDLKIKYARRQLNNDLSLRVEKILDDDCQVWLSGVELALEEFAATDLLPSKILLCGGGSGLPGIKRVLTGGGWAEDLSFAKTPMVGFLQPRDVVHVIDSTDQLKSPQDVTPMALANLVLDIVNEERVMANMLRDALKSVQDRK